MITESCNMIGQDHLRDLIQIKLSFYRLFLLSLHPKDHQLKSFKKLG